MSSKSLSSKSKKTAKLAILPESVLLQPLAEMVGYEASSFCSEAEFLPEDEFVLTLAHAYNDLKSYFFWWEVNRELGPNGPPKISKEFGQFAGIDNHVFRLMGSWLVEMMVLLKEKKSILGASNFSAVISSLSRTDTAAWKSLCDLALVADHDLPKEIKALKTFLVKVRSHGTFHYNQTKPIGSGYTKHFAQPSKPESKFAYASYGKNMEESRFYFADAAITRMCQEMAPGQLATFQKNQTTYVKNANHAIRSIVKKYLELRGFSFRLA
jgi:hypothetical protein